MSPLIPALAALIAAAPGDHPKLERGLDLYRRGDLKGSLPLLLDSLDSGSAKQKATARLYIGLIQHRTGNARDAEGSFKHALDLWPQIRPPKGTPKATMDAFEQVRAKVAPVEPPPPPKKTERKRTTRPGPEVLEPLEGESRSTSRDWSVDRDRDTEEAAVTEPTLETEEEGVPVIGWVAVGVGAAAAVAGATLAIIAGVNGERAEAATTRARGKELYDSASTMNKAALGTFGAAGICFGVAALTVTF